MKNKKITLRFLRAAGTINGSKYPLQSMDKTILVDCGLFQELKKLRVLNWSKLAVGSLFIDLIILTHGYLNHVSCLPLVPTLKTKFEPSLLRRAQ